MLDGLVLLRRWGMGIARVGRRGSGGHSRSCSLGLSWRRTGWSRLGIRCRRAIHRRLSMEFSWGNVYTNI